MIILPGRVSQFSDSLPLLLAFWILPLISALQNFVEKIILESYRSFLVYYFFFTAFNIFSLYLIFAILIMICFDVGLFEFIVFDPICVYYTFISVSIFRFEKFATMSSSNISFSLSFSGIPIMLTMVHLMLCQQSLKKCSHFVINLCLLFWLVDFYYSVFQATDAHFCIT